MNRRMLLVVLASCAAAGPAMADIVNGGFESSLTDGNADPFPGWDFADGHSISIVDAAAGLVHSGQYSARISFSGLDSGLELSQQITGLTPGQFYEVFGMINVTQMDARWAGAGFEIDVNDSKHDGLVFGYIQDSPTEGWAPFAVQFMAPSDGDAWINGKWYGVNSGEAFVDSMAMRTTPAPASAVLLAAGLITPRRRRGTV